MTQIICIIPARGGSKGIFQKNIRPLFGKPLISWSIETAQKCSCIERIILSTDNEEIAQIASDYGADVPFLRPIEFAQDDTPDFPVFKHALSWLAENEGYYPDIVVWLRPTAPLRSPDDITGAVSLLIKTNADWVRSVCLAEYHPYWMKRIEGDQLKPFIDNFDESKFYQRQLLPPAYRLNGAVDVTWRKTIMERGNIYGGDIRGYVMPQDRSVDIDNELDFSIVEEIMKRG